MWRSRVKDRSGKPTAKRGLAADGLGRRQRPNKTSFISGAGLLSKWGLFEYEPVTGLPKQITPIFDSYYQKSR
jgi:hypothetical protein